MYFDGHYEGRVSFVSRDYVTISYDGRQITADENQLDGLRLQKGQPVIFAIRKGQLTNLDIDGTRIPESRQTGRVSRFNVNKDIGLLVGDDGIEVFFNGREVNNMVPYQGVRISYDLFRGSNSIRATKITGSNTASRG